jgi:hypothetical protein
MHAQPEGAEREDGGVDLLHEAGREVLGAVDAPDPLLDDVVQVHQHPLAPLRLLRALVEVA